MKNCNDTYTKNLLKQFLLFELFNSQPCFDCYFKVSEFLFHNFLFYQ